MILLDTPILARMLEPDPPRALCDWFAAHPAARFHLTTLTEAELLSAAARQPPALRKPAIAAMDAMIHADFAGRVLPFDGSVSRDLAALLTRGIPLRTALLAATARTHGATLATTDPAFAGLVDTVNPYDATP